MSTGVDTTRSARTDIESRILQEGHGPGAWHGPDLKAALADVTPPLAFWRPGDGRHNIAEIAVHHAYYINSVRGRLSSHAPEPFVLPGDDWFDLDDETRLSWPAVLATVETEQRLLVELVAAIVAGGAVSPKSDAERLDLVLGITCHAVYHAGQIQLIKRLRTE